MSEFRIFKIATIRDEEEIETIKEYFGVDNLEEVPMDELGEHLIEEYHHEDLEDYKSFGATDDELDAEEVGVKLDPDSEDEGYLIQLTSKSIALRYFKRSDYI